MEYLVGLAALLVGAAIGAAIAWGVLRTRIDAVRREKDEQTEQVRDLEKQLHSKECEFLDRLTAQKRELMAAQEEHLSEAVAKAREAQRSELELQSKLFSVKVSPYVESSESRVLMRTRLRNVWGYQYQLLVNGIPAFAPHVVQERVQNSYTFDQDKLIELAREATQAAVQLYAGGASQFVEIASPIVRQLGRGKQRGDA